MKVYDKKHLQKVLIPSVTIDVLIKHFGEEMLWFDKKLSNIKEDMLLLKEIDIQYNISTIEVTLIDQLIKLGRNLFTHELYLHWQLTWY